MKLNVRDMSSTYCQQRKGVSLERLDRFDREEGQWLEVLIEDPRSGPAETAAARIDFADWFRLLTPRDRRIAAALAIGKTTSEVAHHFRVSPARISQKRHEFRDHWNRFQGEEDASNDTRFVEAAIP
jgi:DNA-directed RNA polymerase sigma subunit (sigma70/sigma32)